MDLVCGVDSSTQSSTVEVRRLDTFELVGTARIPLVKTTPPVSEHDPNDWWDAMCSAIQTLSTQGVRLSDIRAISVSGQCHGLVPLDSECRVIRKAKLWNDTTSAPQVDELMGFFDRGQWSNRMGIIPNPAHTVSKLLWLKQNEPENFDKIAHILLPHDYLTWRLTGQFATDRSEASGTGYWSAVSQQYDNDLLRTTIDGDMAWETIVPEVLPPDAVAGMVTQEAAQATGLPAGIPVAIGGGDQHVGALGLGLGLGDLAYSLGTSGVVLATHDSPVRDEQGWVDGVCDAAGGWLPLVCTLNATKVTDTFARLLGVSVQDLGVLALKADMSAPRPVLVAYLDGERSPSRPGAAGLLGNLNNTVNSEDVALAAFEGVIVGLLRGQRRIEDLGVDTSGRILVAGGGARAQAYRQVLADHTGRDVYQVDAPEATARGACIQAVTILRQQTDRNANIAAVRDSLLPPVVSVTAPRQEAPWAGLMDTYLDLAK
ncbi:MAG: xylulokinase [Actinomycetaceae bacterium]|nr:xylulokinase [Actinomycetaceae bacterium]